MLNMQLSHSLRQGVLRSLVMDTWYIQGDEAFQNTTILLLGLNAPKFVRPMLFIMHFIPWFKYRPLLAIVI